MNNNFLIVYIQIITDNDDQRSGFYRKFSNNVNNVQYKNLRILEVF